MMISVMGFTDSLNLVPSVSGIVKGLPISILNLPLG